MKVDRNSTITQSALAKLTATAKHDVADHLADEGIELGADGYNLFRAVRSLVDRKGRLAEGRSAMDAKLDEDRQFTRLKRLQMAGELVSRTDAERVISQVAAITSNVVDNSWGLDRARRNDLMDRIAEGVQQAWKGDKDEDGEGDE